MSPQNTQKTQKNAARGWHGFSRMRATGGAGASPAKVARRVPAPYHVHARISLITAHWPLITLTDAEECCPRITRIFTDAGNRGRGRLAREGSAARPRAVPRVPARISLVTGHCSLSTMSHTKTRTAFLLGFLRVLWAGFHPRNPCHPWAVFCVFRGLTSSSSRFESTRIDPIRLESINPRNPWAHLLPLTFYLLLTPYSLLPALYSLLTAPFSLYSLTTGH